MKAPRCYCAVAFFPATGLYRSSQNKLAFLMQCDTPIRGRSKTGRQTVLGQFINRSSANVRTNLTNLFGPVNPEPFGRRSKITQVKKGGQQTAFSFCYCMFWYVQLYRSFLSSFLLLCTNENLI